MIRVAVVARSEIVRAGLETLIRSDPELELAPEAGADVVVSAGMEDDEDEAEAATVLIVEEPEAGMIADALRSGVRAVLPVDAAPAELSAAIYAAAAGLTVLRPSDLEGVLAAAPRESAADGEARLSPREVEILQMLAEGLPNKQIAWQLGISEHTVKFHVASILTRLNAGSRAQAVAIGMRRGLILI